MIPATPPSCSIIRSAGGRSTSGVSTSPSTASAVSPASVARFTESASPLNFVVRVVDRLGTVFQLAQPALHTQCAARLDAGNPALPQPHQLDGVGSIEQFGADTVGATFALALHAARRSSSPRRTNPRHHAARGPRSTDESAGADNLLPPWPLLSVLACSAL